MYCAHICIRVHLHNYINLRAVKVICALRMFIKITVQCPNNRYETECVPSNKYTTDTGANAHTQTAAYSSIIRCK